MEHKFYEEDIPEGHEIIFEVWIENGETRSRLIGPRPLKDRREYHKARRAAQRNPGTVTARPSL
jgi:hypothetical protein